MTDTENSNTAKKNKVVIIGLDGATYRVIDPLIAAGRLPNLARLIKGGARGDLQSVIPPVTGPAWTSFMTGKDPGGHGLFDFVTPAADGYGREIVNYSHIRSKTIWAILSEAGFTVGAVAVPVMYPPPEVNGFVVSGMLTPDLESGYTYPPELADEIKEHIGKYIIDIWWQHYNPGQEELLLDALHRCARQRWELSVHLMKSHPTDVFMTVFTSTDRIHHSLWHFIEPEGELDEQGRKIRERIYEIYEEIDRGIGRIVETAGEGADILMMSDHGFGPLNGKFAINTWLRNQGLLSCAATQQKNLLRREKLSNTVKWVIQKIDPSGALRKIVRKFLAHGPARMKPYRFLDYVDWERTKAYSASNTESGIYLNLAGREAKGIVQPGEEAEALLKTIVEKLQEIRDPDTGEQMINRFAFREEIYHGPFVDRAPDIIFFVKNGRYLVDVQLHPEIYLPINWKTGSGTHRIDGFFAAGGPHIRKGITLDKPGIIDLAPTILGLMGVPIPSDMEGKFLEDLIESDFLEKNPISTVAVDPADSLGPARRFDEAETDKLSKQMKDLGYF